jgi:hypothetical protein
MRYLKFIGVWRYTPLQSRLKLNLRVGFLILTSLLPGTQISLG